jgi:hypothetical protein
MLGALLTTWTIRLALACYVAYLAGWLVNRDPRWPVIARWIWTLGCGLFIAHVLFAFHFFHHWSHAAAWQTTAEETRELLGVAFGNGIYFSYLFTAVWLTDVIWLWAKAPRRETLQERTPWTRWLVHGYLFFIAFNGAIVFEGGPIRWAGIAACVVLTILALRCLYNPKQASHPSTPPLTSDF